MALTSNNFISGWSAGANDVVGVEIPPPLLPLIGTYGFRSIGIPGVISPAGNKYLAYAAAVESDANRANCDILTTAQVWGSAGSQADRSGVVGRASGAAGSESAYFCWVNQASTISGTPFDSGVGLYIGKLVAGTLTILAFQSFSSWPSSTAPEDWFIRFRMNGTALKAKAWSCQQAEPTPWTLSITDASIAAAGHIGLAAISLQPVLGVTFNLPGFLSIGTNGETAPRPLSDVEQRAWLNEDSNRRVLLAEVGVLGAAPGIPTLDATLLASNVPFVTEASDVPASQVYDDVLLQVPTFGSKAPTELIGRSSQSLGDAIFKNEDGVRDDWLRWNWDGRSFDMYMGGVGWRRWDFIKVLSGTVYEVYVPKKDQIGLKIRDRSVLLDRKIQLNTMGVGPNAGAPQPLTFGHVFNVEPVLKDAATLRYKYHDESLAGAVGVVQVRNNGASVSFTDQGGGEFTLNADPAGGQITMDIKVDVSLGSTTRAGIRHNTLLRTLVEDRAGLGAGSTYQGLRSGSLANFGADATDEVGLYLKDETNFMDALDQVAGSGGGFWYFNRLGLLCASLVRVPTAPYDWELNEDDVSDLRIEKIMLPSVAAQLGYQKNYTQQTSGLAGSVSVSNRAIYASQAQYTIVVPSYFGSDQPGNHLLRQVPRNRDTLLYNAADANDEVTRLDGVYSKTCALVSFLTKYNSIYYNLGDSLNLVYPRFGFDAGQAGIVVGLDENFESAEVRITLFVQLAGVLPMVAQSTPYVTVSDFY